MTNRKFTRAELNRAHELYDLVKVGLAFAAESDWSGDGDESSFDCCKLMALVETLSRRLGRLQVDQCNVADRDDADAIKREAARDATRAQLREVAHEWRNLNNQFEVEFTTAVNCPVILKVDGRNLSLKTVFHD